MSKGGRGREEGREGMSKGGRTTSLSLSVPVPCHVLW